MGDCIRLSVGSWLSCGEVCGLVGTLPFGLRLRLRRRCEILQWDNSDNDAEITSFLDSMVL